MSEPTIDEIWEYAINGESVGDTTNVSDTDSDFSDEEGNYCINDDCVMPSDNFIEQNGSMVCNICGTTQYTIHEEQEWNNYLDSQGGYTANNSRCSAPSNSDNYFSNNCGTFLPQGFKMQMTVKVCQSCKGKKNCKVYFHKFEDKTCRKCGGEEYVKETIYRDISKLHMRLNYNHKEKSFNLVKTYIENFCTEEYSKPTIDTAMQLWEEVMKANKLTRAGVREGLIACCIYYACIHNNGPVSVEKICKDFKMVGNSNFNKGEREFKHVFENSPKWSHLLKDTINPDDMFTGFCTKLDLPYKYVHKCKEFVDKYKLNKLSIDPKSIASGVIFVICKQNGIILKKVDVCKKLNVCNPTLSKAETLINKKIEKYNKRKS